jgi:hypothetical protein
MGAIEVDQSDPLMDRHERIAGLYLLRSFKPEIENHLVEVPLGTFESSQLRGGLESSGHPWREWCNNAAQLRCVRHLGDPLSHHVASALAQKGHDRRVLTAGDGRKRRQYRRMLREAFSTL